MTSANGNDPEVCTPAHCLCGCGKAPNRDRCPRTRFRQGHDQTARVRLGRLSQGIPIHGDEAVLAENLLVYYRENPHCQVVDDWYAHDLLRLAGE